jgi:hypothetical protein
MFEIGQFDHRAFGSLGRTGRFRPCRRRCTAGWQVTNPALLSNTVGPPAACAAGEPVKKSAGRTA